MPETRTKPLCLRDDAVAVLRRLREAGHIAYFAGGCVRDLLLGLEPKDYDVATDAPPKRVRQLFPNTQAVGQAFGVILVRQGKSVVEVATFRTDADYQDGRRPSSVTFTTPEHDAQRRDFTINGLFLDPLNHDRVIDYVDGQRDLSAKILRAIGDPQRRFAEDHLRLMRAVRFASRFDMEIEASTAEAILGEAPKLKRISPERIADELRLMLSPPTRARAWPLLWRFRLVEVIFRFLPWPEGAALDPARSIFLNTACDTTIWLGLALAAACLDIHWQSKPPTTDIRPLLQKQAVHKMVRAMRQALRLSNEELDLMQDTLEGLAPLLDDAYPGVATLKRFLARQTAPHSTQLLDALDRVGLCRERIARLREDFARFDGADVAPPPLITGDDLVAAGLVPGRQFKAILESIYDAQLEDRVNSKSSALHMALELAAK